MHNWVYIATPSGASLGKTVRLAKGREYLRGEYRHRESGDRMKDVFGKGVIRRSLETGGPAGRMETPHLRELKPGHTILLAYDLFHSRIVYPIGTFTLSDPASSDDPRVDTVTDFPALGCLACDEWDAQKLEPDYVGDSAYEYVLIGEFEKLGAKDATAVYERTYDQDHALHPAIPRPPLKQIKSGRERELLERALVPQDDDYRHVSDEIGEFTPHLVRLDGRARQLLIENRLAERALGCATRSYALAALPLCLLVEYDLQRLLAKLARRRLKNGDHLRVGEGPYGPELSWIPDPSVCESGFSTLVWLFRKLKRELGTDPNDDRGLLLQLGRIRNCRNRLAHSFFLEKKHYDDLKQYVSDVLDIIYTAPEENRGMV